MREIVAAAVALVALAGLVGHSPEQLPERYGGVHVDAEFVAADPGYSVAAGAAALSYHPDLVPVGARARVMSRSTAVGTFTVLRVRGLAPHRGYGAHVHVGGCGHDPAEAGPHYQHVPDPVTPSVDPEYANPRNEIWLDLRTDAQGNGFGFSAVRWRFDDRPAGAVVLHEHLTHTDPGVAGQAGARVGCVTVPFAR